MSRTIFYGAGAHAAKILGDNPAIAVDPAPPSLESGVCFADSDPAKWGSVYMGLPVEPVVEALSEYRDADIYITLGDLGLVNEVDRMLFRHGVYNYRIKSTFPLLRTSCDYLQNFIVCGYHEGAFGGKAGTDIGGHTLKSCCSDYGKNNVEVVPIGEDYEASFLEFLTLRDETIRKLNIGEPTKCDGCKELKSFYSTENRYFKYVIYNELGVCNCKCSYCNYTERLGRDATTDVDFVKLLGLVRKYGFDEENGIIELCNGEITIHPQKYEIYEAVKHSRVMFLTNGLVFDEFIYRKLKAGSGILNVSIDCGTRETFKKVKGIDSFDRVAENLMRYAEECSGVFNLKYIVLPGINDNREDIDGYMELCDKLNANAHVSHNLRLSFEDYDNVQTRWAVNYLIESLKERKVSIELYSRDILAKLLE